MQNEETIAGGGSQTGELDVGQDPQVAGQPTTETTLSHKDGVKEQAQDEIKPVLGELGERLGPEGERNIRLSKKKQDLALPEGMVNVGMKTYNMPNKEAQLGGFWVEEPGTFIAQFGQYKFATEKGEKTPPVNI
jgi:hypothetical protein